MRAILTRQSGVTAIVNVYPARQGIPTKVLENRVLEMFNSFEKEAKALESKMKNKL